jgi:hypothetical protein
MTQQEIQSCTVPTEEILQDIEITQREINNYRDEVSVLSRNHMENRTRIYLNEGKIAKREEFIKNLREIIAYRESNKQ